MLNEPLYESTSSGRRRGARPEYVLGGRKRDEGNAYEMVAHAACAAPEAEAQRTLGTLGTAVWLSLPEQFDFGEAIERTLVSNTTHEVRPQLAAFTKQRDNTKRSQRLRYYRGRHEYSKTRGSRVNGRRSIAPRREWNDRHFMNREPSPIELSAASGELRRCARAAPSPQGPQLGPAPAPVPAPAEVTLQPNMAARTQEVRSLPIGTSPSAAGAADTRRRPALEQRTRTRMRRYRYPQKALAARSPSRHGLAHANRFPAAGRLMRAGRAGAGGGSDACAHRRPSLSAGMQSLRCERDDNNSLSQRRLVNTNRSRSRDKIFDLHFTTHTSACADRVATAPHTCALLANCSRPPPRRRRAAGDILQFFQKTDMHRHRGRGAPACHVAATQHYHRPPTTVGHSTPHTDYTTF
ncbi:hypothetical protein SFRURICE_012373 [Spodoptera frugiperda]|nr:hypothetical protein SFRURICE_012373 [Spodoptera frugiperda]